MSPAKNSLIPALIGREDQLALMRRCLAEAAAGTGSIVVIRGEAGLGKSRLLEEAAALAHERGSLVLRGSGIARAEKVPNGMLAGVLTDFLACATGAEVSAVREVVAQLMPHLWSAIFRDEPAADAEPAEMRPELRQSLFLARVTALLVERSRRQPVLVCFDDLHWADSASVRALQPLAQQLADAPLTILATLRPEEAPEDETLILPRIMQGLQRFEQFSQIDLPALTAQQTRAVAVSCFRREALSVEFFDLLFTRSGGVPLFVIQYLDFLLERGVIHQQHGLWINRRLDEGDIPDTVRDTIRGRIKKLPEDERDLLSLAAVQGPHFEGGMLAKALAQPVTRILRDLDELGRRTHLIKVDGRGFRFSHPVLADAFYQLLPLAKRRHIHLRLAYILERDRPKESQQLAYHLYHAQQFDRALPHLLQSARQARDSFALRESRLYLTQARRCLPDAGDATGAVRDTSVAGRRRSPSWRIRHRPRCLSAGPRRRLRAERGLSRSCQRLSADGSGPRPAGGLG